MAEKESKEIRQYKAYKRDGVTAKQVSVLSQAQRWELAEMMVTGKKREEIIEHFKKQHGIEMFNSMYYYYKYDKKWKKCREEIKNNWDNEFKGEYLASKRNRLRELEKTLEGDNEGAKVSAIRQASIEVDEDVKSDDAQIVVKITKFGDEENK